MPTGVYKRTEETEKKRIENRRKNGWFKNPKETKRKMSETKKRNPTKYWKGKKRYKETNDKISKKLTGRKLSASHIKNVIDGRKGYRHSEETKRKIGLGNFGNKWSIDARRKISGSNNCWWRGGISSLRTQIYNSVEYKSWRRAIFERDNYICMKCCLVGGTLNPHHIKSFSEILEEYKIKTVQEALNCKELWNIDNGLTLCKRCHKLTDNYGGKKSKKFKGYNLKV